MPWSRCDAQVQANLRKYAATLNQQQLVSFLKRANLESAAATSSWVAGTANARHAVFACNARHAGCARCNGGPRNLCARCNRGPRKRKVCARCTGGPTQGVTCALLTCPLLLGRHRCVSRSVHEPVFGAVSLDCSQTIIHTRGPGTYAHRGTGLRYTNA